MSCTPPALLTIGATIVSIAVAAYSPYGTCSASATSSCSSSNTSPAWPFGKTYNSAEFCDASRCKNCLDASGRPAAHIACITRPGFDYATCPPDTVALEMTPELEALIVDLHNQLRSRVATGQLTGYQTCDRMVEMSWCDKLAYVASCNAGECEFRHDKCRNTAEYPNSGQNIASVGLSNAFKDDREAIVQMVKMWSDESDICTMDVIKSFRIGSGKEIGHFTQMAHGDCNKVGCAATKYKTKDGFFQTYLVCNYAVTNMLGQCVYPVGPTAQSCRAGPSARYGGLCCADEAKLYPPGSQSSAAASSSASAGPNGAAATAAASSASGGGGPSSSDLCDWPQAAIGQTIRLQGSSAPTTVITRQTHTDANGVTTTSITRKSVKSGSSYLSSASASPAGFGDDADFAMPSFDNDDGFFSEPF